MLGFDRGANRCAGQLESEPTVAIRTVRAAASKNFTPQNCGAVAQTLLATSRAPDDLRLLRFCNGFRLQRDRSVAEARRAADRKLARLHDRPRDWVGNFV